MYDLSPFGITGRLLGLGSVLRALQSRPKSHFHLAIFQEFPFDHKPQCTAKGLTRETEVGKNRVSRASLQSGRRTKKF